MKRILGLLTGLSVFCLGSALAEEPISEYSSTAARDALVSRNFAKDSGTASGSGRLCPGFGGYQLILAGDDDRSWINVKFGDRITDLYQVSMQNAPGFFATKSNDVVEWRGREVAGRFVPHAIIYRISGFHEDSQTTKTRLLVFKLRDGAAEFAGSAEGAGEDARAKKLADDSLRKAAK